MEWLAVILIALLVFGVCFLLDKGFTKIFRNKAQHRSGLSVRLNKRYGSMGAVIAVLGVASLLAGIPGQWALLSGGIFLIIVGIALIVYYMTFGIFYDDNSFISTGFGRRSRTYHYRDICSQQLYNSYGNTVIELRLSDGRTVQLHTAMEGTYAFLDKAFAAWLVQKGLRAEDCPFHDPDNSCWFPRAEE